MRKRLGLKKQLLSTDGSSMISVLVAFIILLIGIAGFSHAVTTANDMVRRAEMLNMATGKVLTDYFYPEYAGLPSAWDSVLLDVYEEDGAGTKTQAFSLHGQWHEREYTITIDTGEDTTTMPYQMYFYK